MYDALTFYEVSLMYHDEPFYFKNVRFIEIVRQGLDIKYVIHHKPLGRWKCDVFNVSGIDDIAIYCKSGGDAS